MNTAVAIITPNRVVNKKVMAILIIFWVVGLLLAWSANPSEIIPGPIDVFKAFGDLYQDGIMQHLLVSLMLSLKAIMIGALISMVLAYSTVLSIFKPLVVLISKFRFISLVGLGYIFTRLFSGGGDLKLSMLTFFLVAFMVTSIMKVVASVTDDELEHARTLRMSEWHVVWEVVILGKMHEVWEEIRGSAAIGWSMLTMVEGIVRSEGGIGAQLLIENKHFELAAAFAIQALILVIGLYQDFSFAWLKRLFFPYSYLRTGRK